MAAIAHPAVPAMAAAALLAAAVAAYAARHRDAVGATPLAAIAVGAAIWSGAGALAASAGTSGATRLWTDVMYLGVATVPTAWLAFTLEYSGRAEWLTPRTVALLALEPAAVLALVWTNPLHGLYWSSTGLAAVDGVTVLVVQPGPGFWVNVAYSYLLVAAGVAIVVRLAIGGGYRYRSQALALLVGSFAPWVAHALHVAGVAGFAVDPTPVALVVTTLALSWAVFRRELLEFVPATRRVAREELLESMADGVVVVNERGVVVDLNPAGAVLLGAPREEAVGSTLGAIAPDLEAALPDEPPVEDEATGVTLDRGGAERRYDVRLSPVGRDDDAVGGYLIVVRDVTERERQQQRLAVLNRVLRHDLRNEMNLLLAAAEELRAGGVDLEEGVERIREKGLEITELADRARELEGTIAGDEVVLERVDLVAVVEGLLDRIERDYPEACLGADLPESAPVYANGLIDSAVRNLIENAVEHNDREEPVVRVSIERGTEFCTLRIADDGPGIPAEERAVLERGTETQLRHSSGLGLWLVHWIVTESGGRIAFEENEPRGTVAVVSLIPAEG